MIRVWGTINGYTVSPNLYQSIITVPDCVNGQLPFWANGYRIEYVDDCEEPKNFDIRHAVPVYGGLICSWGLLPLAEWLESNLTEPLTLPSISSSTTENIYIVVDLSAWLADPRIPQDNYVISDGECADLPGYLIGTTPIVFNQNADPTENPFQTTTFTGTVDLAGSSGYDIPEEIPTLSEWGMIVLALLLLTGGTVAVIRRRKAVAASE